MSIKILIVDDEVLLQTLMQQRFRHKIRTGEYEFRFALSGRQALDSIRENTDIDVVLLDINMPDISGLALLAQLPDLLPLSQVVMVSAYGDLNNIRLAMNRGAFDFVMKPINFQDLETTIDKTARYVSQLRESVHTKAVAELKARFFDNITHEFRTPLSLILAPVDALLQNTQHDNRTRHSLLTIRQNGRQLLHLINQLLDLTKLEAGSLPIIELRGDVILFVTQVVDSFRVIAEQKELALFFSTDTAGHEVLFDGDKWEKILKNLLSNALKFTSPGGWVSVTCQLQPDRVVLTISDSGIGIPAEHLPHIFDRFYQVVTSLTRSYEGSGIGLALANELTRQLGGTVSVESTPAVGTTFIVALPVRPLPETATLENPQLVSADTEPWLFTRESAEDDDADAAKPLILLVEDNSELLAFIAESLTGLYRVLTATNGRDALDIAQRELPDVVVTDVMMPELDGYQLTRHLKNNPTTDHICVVLLTARSAPASRREGLAEGADDYLTKPFDLDELRLRLRNLISRQHKLRAFFERQMGSLLLEEKADETPPVTAREAFLTKLNKIIEANLDDSNFRAETMADEVCMSIRTLTRKLTMLTGISPGRLVRTYRLRRAIDLLRQGHPIAETAYMVGFENPSYFTRAFKEIYQKTPSEYLAVNEHLS
ncbi:hybrid sensor histidine kinase/response regulator transcription factor [Spirosoma fluviale]|uniref:histidine kinase n=1 Tax=Spirosoma fluviale TaxID=1597977 RepID=A0A286G9H0_9BACT|nr:response regulator [Spirosoma fluviale]SOD92122.1 Signal transduction histidine kinase [Spirosoma fluviale]